MLEKCFVQSYRLIANEDALLARTDNDGSRSFSPRGGCHTRSPHFKLAGRMKGLGWIMAVTGTILNVVIDCAAPYRDIEDTSLRVRCCRRCESVVPRAFRRKRTRHCRKSRGVATCISHITPFYCLCELLRYSLSAAAGKLKSSQYRTAPISCDSWNCSFGGLDT